MSELIEQQPLQPILQQKVFIIGLPRTATTSVCLAMLSFGLKTAHNAYTQNAFFQAQVIADTPVFCDFQQLDKDFPNSKFVYLVRKPDKWLPSIKQLLQRMIVNLQRSDGGFNPHLKRCYNDVFSPLTAENIEKDEFLLSCYLRHQQAVFSYFKNREQDLLTIDVSEEHSYNKLLNFLATNGLINSANAKNIKTKSALENKNVGFRQINIGGKVKAWQAINHVCKVESTNKGKIDKILY